MKTSIYQNLKIQELISSFDSAMGEIQSVNGHLTLKEAFSAYMAKDGPLQELNDCETEEDEFDVLCESMSGFIETIQSTTINPETSKINLESIASYDSIPDYINESFNNMLLSMENH